MTTQRSNGAASAWLLLLLAGQAAMLALTVAGPRTRYQHIITPDRQGAMPSWALAILGLQLLAVLVGVMGMRGEIGPMLRRAANGPWRALIAFAVMAACSTALSRNVRDYVGDVAVTTLLQLLAIGNVVLFARALPDAWLARARERFLRILGPSGEGDAPEPGGLDRFALGCALWALAVAVVLAVVPYQRFPHVPDELGYLLHAKYFATGHLTMPLPPAADAFNIDLMTYEATRWYSPVNPGWPLALAVGARFGVPWLVNPVLGALDVLLLYLVLRELFPRRTARLGLLLFAASPWQLFLSMGFMGHQWTLCCALLGALQVARMRRDGRLWRGVVGGAAVGMVGMARPLEGLVVALLLGFWSLGARARWVRFAPSAVLTLATLAVGGLVLPYNKYLTGHAGLFPINDYFDRLYVKGANDLGFGPNRGFGWAQDPYPGHGLRDVLVNSNLNLTATNVELLGWATGAAALIALVLVARRPSKSDWWMILTVFAVTTAHHFYWFSGGPDFGARYWYLIIVPCIALAARSLERLEGLAGSPRVLSAAAALTAGTVLLFIPWRSMDKYWHYRGHTPGAGALAREHHAGRSLILVRGNRDRDYASAQPENPVDLTAPQPIFAWDRSAAARAAVLEAYRDRPIWFFDGPSIADGGWRVVAGPISADSALRVPGLWTTP